MTSGDENYVTYLKETHQKPNETFDMDKIHQVVKIARF